MLKDPKSTPSSESTRTPVEGEVAASPHGLKLWESQSLAPERRKEAYTDLVREKLQEIQIAFDRAREAGDISTQKEIMNSPETKKWMDEGTWLQAATAEEFCARIDRTELIALLGKNFLGAEAWKAQQTDVGKAPPIPEAITESLLESDCPLHPGEKIKDTHLLVLIPKTVNGEPYTPLKLDELCAARQGSGHTLIYDGGDWETWRKSAPWASAPQAESEWVLLPKNDPDPRKVSEDKHFRNKDLAEQQKVHDDHYREYREVKTVELMTAALLYDLTHKERLLPDYLRCAEPNDSDGRNCVGYFTVAGLKVRSDVGDGSGDSIGRALARKS